MTIAELRDSYILRLNAENRSANTIRAYTGELRRFAQFVGADTDIQTISAATLRKYISHCGGSPSSIQRRRAVLKSCLEEAVNIGKASRNAGDFFYRAKLREPLPYCPSEAELLTAIEKPCTSAFSKWPTRDKALLEVAYATMARISELRGMDVGDINWREHTIRVNGKGNKERLVLFGEAAEKALREYLTEREQLLRGRKQTGALFLNRSRRESAQRMSIRRLHSTIKTVCVGLGMSKMIHPHSLRRAGATHMLNRGCDLRVLKLLLGHEKLGTTAKYARLAPERLRDVFANTHPDNYAEY